MNRRALLSKLILIFLLPLICFCESRGVNPGEKPPAFKLPDLDGKMHSLSSYEGKVVLLNFWASWCQPCITELPALESLFNMLKDQGFSVLAIGIDDDIEALRRFKEQFSLSFPVLVDKNGLLKGKYKVTGVPESFLVGRDGKLVMIADFEDNMPVVRIVGPREWTAPNAVARIKELLRAD